MAIGHKTSTRCHRFGLYSPCLGSVIVFLVTCLIPLTLTNGLGDSSILQRRKSDGPSISKYEFVDPPVAPTPFYFEDSEAMLILDDAGNVLRSSDGGLHFKFLDDMVKHEAYDIILHPFEFNTAYIWGRQFVHYVTRDRGETWHAFKLEGVPAPGRQPLSFQFGNPHMVLINVCRDPFICEETAYYTIDGFKTDPQLLRQDTRGCVFARSTPEWGNNFIAPDKGAENDKGTDSDNRIVCAVAGRYNQFPFSGSHDNRLAVSDNYFKDETEPQLEAGRTVQGIVNIATVKGFLVAAASARGTDELALYVTDDAYQWHRAVFPKDHRVAENAYTILESTNYSIQVDVMSSSHPQNGEGVLFTSNSNGTYFTRNIEHVNRNIRGMVDFEKISGIQGVILVNVISNWKDLIEDPLGSKKVRSKISFDDGRSFQDMRADDKDVHLHSVSDMSNSGRIFSSPAPGVVMGVGNHGKHLKPYEEGNLYVSDDAGLSWSQALKGPHKYEFGDQGAVLLAVPDDGPTDTLKFSIDHGKNWQETSLGEKVTAVALTTMPDSTSLKFFLMAAGNSGPNKKYSAYTIDFEDYHSAGKCKDEDFEKWYARVNDKGDPTCIMGHKQWYRRRKSDSKCFVDKEFDDPVAEYEACACTRNDFECDYNFVLSEDGKECIPAGSLQAPEGLCQEDEDTFKDSSGFRLIPGNACDRDDKDSIDLDKKIDRPCRGAFRPPASGKVTSSINSFESELAEYHYPERTDRSQGDDETVMFRTRDGKAFLSKDAGKKWERIFKNDKIVALWPHGTMKDVVFFLTGGKKVFYTYNRGDTFGHFKAPEEPSEDGGVSVLGFHPEYKDWLIWTGAADCKHEGNKNCHNVAFFSEDRGATWEHRLRYVKKCEFIPQIGVQDGAKKLVYCEQHRDERNDQPLELKWSENWFAEDNKVFDDVIDFATMSEFIVVATRRKDNEKSLSCHASIDGKQFADAQFPPSFDVPMQKAYTVLESKNHAVFLHVTVNNQEGSEYGSLIKSNSNGTSYVMSLPRVNRNRAGYVDFEKMHSLEGVILANVVSNADGLGSNTPKLLKSKISHNDGGQWAPLPRPAVDLDGKPYTCAEAAVEDCSLHLHSYTERRDKRNTFSSETAVGLMIGVGNVGANLLARTETDTFMTRNGGIEWSVIQKGSYLWKYGDQGSIVVIVKEDSPTRNVLYSTNEGQSWTEYQFADSDYRISSLSTGESGQSRNFVLWGVIGGEEKLSAINIDFSGLTDTLCQLDETAPEAGDFYLWEPRHPLQKDNCLFGHVAQYHRKKLESTCYNGPSIERLHRIDRNCACTRDNFECDYNFEMANDGSCQLVPGLQPADHSEQCAKDGNLKSYFLPTGYRHSPMDTCEGGQEFEFTSKELPCPGKEGEFEQEQRRKGLSGFWFFMLAILFPITTASLIGYWVYHKWDGKFGRIRLGADGGLSESLVRGPDGSIAIFDASQPWIRYPVVLISGLVAVVAAMPLLISSAWRGIKGFAGRGGDYSRVGTYNTRDDFARGAGRYAVVDPDEDELLGEDDEDVPPV